MKDQYEQKLRNALFILNEIEGFIEFHEEYTNDKKVESRTDFFSLLNSFKEHLASKNSLGENEKIIISNVKEISEKVGYENSQSKIFIVNETLKPKETFLEEFLEEFTEAKTGDLFFEEVRPRRFKTITESLALHGMDGKKLTEIYDKYKDYNHPLIYFLISEPLINSKDFTNGISILEKALKYAFRYPNYYWHSMSGIEGCAWSLFSIQYLLGIEGIDEAEKQIPQFRQKLLKLIYLYLSRYIHMSGNNIKSIDCYSNRARLMKDYYMDFIGIFGLGVNPDIQFISDYYLAYQVAMNNNLSGLPPFRQLMWESMKMYRHGSHIPNSTGGYQEIEDRTWMELVRDGELRSIRFSERFLNEFEAYELNLSNPEIEYICRIAMSRNKDDFQDYIEKLNKKESGA